MIGDRTDSRIAEFNIYRCLSCDLTITSAPPTAHSDDNGRRR